MPSPLKQTLSHVYWIGGSPCSGKSSIVQWLADRHVFQSYNCDQAFERHCQIITAEGQPAFYRLMQMSWDEIWMRPVGVQVEDEFAVYQEEFELILRDLQAMPTDRPIVAEGAALLPHLVAPLLDRPDRAIWIVPAEAFQREMYPRRGAWVQEILRNCTHPEQAFQNWMDRDIAFARRGRAEAEARGLHVLVVDGSRTVAENAAVVEMLFFRLAEG